MIAEIDNLIECSNFIIKAKVKDIFAHQEQKF